MSDPIQPLTRAQTAEYEASGENHGYVMRCLVALDQFANVVAGGESDETLSSRWARADLNGSRLGRLGSRILDLFQPDHGARAQAGDLARGEAVAASELDAGDLDQPR